MCGQGSASNIDKSLIEPSHDVASQLSTMGLTPVKRKTTTKDQLEHHSTGVHKKPNVEHLSTSHCTSTHMYGQGNASNNDKSLIEPSHDVASQLLTMGLTPAINDNDLLGCTHPHVYVDDKATSAVTEGFNVCLPNLSITTS
ncbi:hypothetical protein Tco_0676971 [Tanacetum coccineum]